MKKTKIKIEILSNSGQTILINDNFDSAIIDLINEREWFNYWEKEMIKKNIKKVLK